MKDRLKASWPLLVAIAFALFIILSGWEIKKAYPGEDGIDRGLWNYSQQDIPTGQWSEPCPPSTIMNDVQQEQIDRLRFEVDVLKNRLRALEDELLRFQQAFRHLLETS